MNSPDLAAGANVGYLQKHPGTKLQGTTANRSIEDQIAINRRSAGCLQHRADSPTSEG